MGLLENFSSGLFIIQSVIFLVLIFVLRKFAWKPIMDAVNEREVIIVDSLNQAKLAKQEVQNLKAENEVIIREAKVERDNILKEAREMVLQEIELVKKGEFPDWMLPSIINDFKIQRMKGLETAEGLANNLYDTYIKGRTWEQELNEMDEEHESHTGASGDDGYSLVLLIREVCRYA